jgi:transposase
VHQRGWSNSRQEDFSVVAKKKIDVEIARRMAAEGKSVQQMADRMGVSYDGMYSALRDNGIRARDSRFRCTVDIDALRADWISGMSVKAMMERHKVSNSHVYYLSRKYEFPLRDKSAKTRRVTDEDILTLHREGMSSRHIAEAVGVSHKSVYRRLSQLVGPKAEKAAPKPKPEAPSKAFPPLHARVLRTKGRWSALAEIAAQEGLRMAQVQRIWHEVRVG